MLNDSSSKKSIPEREEEVLRFWQEKKIFEKSLELRNNAEPFVFYDGPPFATGQPHYGHILASVIKDVIPRYQTMRGRFVPRRWGWDCHGLPLENIVEQELGLKTKKDIEKYGIAKFNKEAEARVLRYADDWKKVIPRIGRWVDMKRDYKTMDWTYTESVWWAFSELYKKGLVGEGYKSMHLCPRCETTLANFEVAQGYKTITDRSVIVKFQISPNTYVLAWTTTPWTLPGNVALAVKPDAVYVVVAQGDEKYIIAKERLEMIKGEYDVIEEMKGTDLVGALYMPPFDYFASRPDLKNRENGWKIYPASFVTLDEGTGIVHVAPAFGEEDMNLGKEYNLPFIQHVTRQGAFTEEVRDFAGMPVKPKEDPQKTDVKIIEHLAEKGLLYAKETIIHSYPHCWRCETPLLNYAASSWFVYVPRIREELRTYNDGITWIPAHLKEGRFGKGLETAPDWAVSRSRFWGAPLPVWKCVECNAVEVVGSLEELEKKRRTKPNTFLLIRHGVRQDFSRELDNPDHHDAIVISSRPDSPIHLSQEGRAGIQRLAEKLKREGGVDAIFSSDFIRTKETAEIISEELGVPVAYDERLRELNHGDEFEGKTVKEYRTYFASPPDRFTKTPKGGENLRNVRKRMMSFVREFDRKNEGKKVLVISHGDPLWILESALEGRSEEETLETRKNYIRQGEIRACSLRNVPYNEDGALDLHRPYIDEITLHCACGNTLRRIPEVFDCWFESGSMPYGEHHYMGKPVPGFNPRLREGNVLRSSKSEEGFPADFIAEGLDQTRGWFYSLHVLAGALFKSSAYRHVVVNGTILAQDGQKMSKRLKNYPDPMDVVGKYGADALRSYLLSSPAVAAEDLNFSEKGVDEVAKKVIARLNNVYAFYMLYAADDIPPPRFDNQAHALDKYILVELSHTEEVVRKALDGYQLGRAARAVADFTDIVSTVYLQYSRERLKEDKKALAYFRYTLCEFAKIAAPLIPFFAEHAYQSVRYEDAQESVHLENWPTLDSRIQRYDDEYVRDEMALAQSAIECILAKRSVAGIPVRQPLALAKVRKLPPGEEFRVVIRERVNVERVEEDADMKDVAWIDTVITDELREKGMLRAFVRSVQDLRKKEGLMPGDRIVLSLTAGEKGKNFVEKFTDEIKKSVGADEIICTEQGEGHEISIGEISVTVRIREKI